MYFEYFFTNTFQKTIWPSLYSHSYCIFDEYLLVSTGFVPGSGFEVIKSKPGSVTESGVDFNYLRFLDMCSQANLFRYVNDGTRAVRLPSTLHIGRCTYNNFYVILSHYVYGYDITLYFDLDKL